MGPPLEGAYSRLLRRLGEAGSRKTGVGVQGTGVSECGLVGSGWRAPLPAFFVAVVVENEGGDVALGIVLEDEARDAGAVGIKECRGRFGSQLDGGRVKRDLDALGKSGRLDAGGTVGQQPTGQLGLIISAGPAVVLEA